uniref:Small-subunit processome Utp21 domain-containing protein n=1 Tax=Amorphochlora amoebiformis TaxID=1561963 RepID=A0A7S0D1C2_9EUKA
MSVLFAPYRTVGHVVDSVPFHLKRLGTETFVTVTVGRAWQVYNLEKLRLAMIGPRLPLSIRAISSLREWTYVTQGTDILIFHRAEIIGRLRGDSVIADSDSQNREQKDINSNNRNPGEIYILKNLGDTLLAIGENQYLDVWSTREKELQGRWRITTIENRRAITIEHPATYLNKIVIGFDNGDMELINIITGKIVHKFNTTGFSPPRLSALGTPLYESGKAPSRAGISIIVQSPAVDVVGIGMTDGTVVIHNLKFDKTILRFRHDPEHGAVTCLSFRSAGNVSPDTPSVSPTLISASSEGQIAVWDIKERQLAYILEEAHDGAIISATFVPGEPILITAGVDNSLKVWIFDKPPASGTGPGVPRILRERSGHRLQPTRIRFFADKGDHMLSAGLDQTLRAFNLYRPQQSAELSQGKGSKSNAKRTRRDARKLFANSSQPAGRRPLSAIKDFEASAAREREWANIVACHTNTKFASTWKFHRRALGPHQLGLRNRKTVTAVCVSACGHFSVIGLKTGEIQRYNLQSGLPRKTYRMPKSKLGHRGELSGLAVDAINLSLVSSGLDGRVRVWDFHSYKLERTVLITELDEDQVEGEITKKTTLGVSQLILSRESELAAIIADDLGVRVIDIRSAKIVRIFGGHANKVTDMAFSPDSRWLATSCMDGGIRIFDIPSGRLIDWLEFSAAPVSLAFSPRGDFLATAHTNNVGIFLWANKTYAGAVYLKGTPENPTELDVEAMTAIPTAGSENADKSSVEEKEKHLKEAKKKDRFDSVTMAGVEAKAPGIVTLSGLPNSRWINLSKLELIKERNKPTEAPKKPAEAPFFLATTNGLNPTLDPNILENDKSTENDSKELTNFFKQPHFSLPESKLARLMINAHKASKAGDKRKRSKAGDITPVIDFLRSLGPSKIDSEIRNIGVDVGREETELAAALSFFERALAEKRNFDFINAILALFLKVHSDSLASMGVSMLQRIRKLRKTQKETWRKLERQFHYSICMVNQLSGIQQ